MLKHSTSLGTLFGRRRCPLFLATALLVAPGVANSADIIISVDTNETNGDATNLPSPGNGESLIVNEGVTMTIDEDGAGLTVIGVSDVVITNNGSIYTFGTENDCGFDETGAGCAGNEQNTSGEKSFGYADGMYIVGADYAQVTNNGLIDVDDYRGTAMFVQGESALITNNNQITVRGEYGIGMSLGRGSDAYLLNNGTITMNLASNVTGMNVFGWNPADDLGDPTDNRFATTTGHLLVNTGVIEWVKDSTNTGFIGMRMDGTDEEATGVPDEYDQYRYIVDAQMYNYGTIRVILTAPPGDSGAAYHAAGMRTAAHNVDIYNYGTIDIGSTGRGIDATGSGLGVYNYGTIIVDGGNADPTNNGLLSVGMEVFLDRAILNYGDATTDILRTDGTEADYRNKAVNAGLIRINNTRATLGAGVHIKGDSGQDFYNYGTVISPNGWSLLLDADDGQGSTGIPYKNNAYLFDGSILVGDLNVNPYSRVEWNLHFGDGYNAALRFDDTENQIWYSNRIHLGGAFPTGFHSPNGFVLVDNVAYVVDLESYSQQDQTTWSMVSMIQDAVDEETKTRPPEGDFAFNGDGSGGPSNKWARMFAGWVYDPGDGAVVVGDEASDERDGGYNGYSAGTIVGVNKAERSYFFGAAYSQVSSIDDMDNDTGYETYSGTLFAGISSTLRERFNLSMTTGVSFNHTDRDIADNRSVTGLDSVTANYVSAFLSPSLLVDGPWGSSMRLNYLGAWTQDHSYELSGGEELKVKKRYAHVFGSQFQMVHDIPMMENVPLIGERFPARVRYGVEGHYALGSDIKSTVTLPGFTRYSDSLKTPYNDGFTARGFAGLDLGPAFVEAGYDTDEQVSVSAGLKIRF
ncbi:hypothetical protein [Roseibium sp.]|uniref:hypothetical protein n=1 Tax=Roseibium sp. TaxID=1936156 RepID=UPI003B514E21